MLLCLKTQHCKFVKLNKGKLSRHEKLAKEKQPHVGFFAKDAKALSTDKYCVKINMY